MTRNFNRDLSSQVLSTSRTIRGLVRDSARRFPDAVALLGLGRDELTYRELDAQLDSLVKSLGAAGIGETDRVAIVLPNGPEMAIAFLAVTTAAVAAPLNPAYREEEFAFYLRDLGARAVLVEAGTDSSARRVARAHGIALLEVSRGSDARLGRIILSATPVEPAASPSVRRPEDVALVLHTSGTTARPKIVPLTHGNLCASAAHVCAALHLGSVDRCLNIMPLFHIHGLVAALFASLAAGASIACCPAFCAPEFFSWFDECSPTWYTAVPTMHQAILARAGHVKDVLQRSRLRFIRSSSASLPPQVLTQLEAVFGVPVVEAYGMTEAAHQIACNPFPPASRKPGSVGRAAGPEIAIRSEGGEFLAPGNVGEIVIRGANVTSGYQDNPAANAAAFADGWFRTGDQGVLDEAGYLTITGRLKEIINRGGEKVAPREVEEVLLDHPAVAQAVAFAVPHAALGEDIAAAVVLGTGQVAQADDLRNYAANRLAYFKVPSQLLIVQEIPKGPTGKPQRIGMAQRLGLVPAVQAPTSTARPLMPPRTELEAALVEIWKEVLRVDHLGVDHSFLEVGGDSILALRILARVRALLALELPVHTLFDASTVAGMAAAIEQVAAKQLETEEMSRLVSDIEGLSDEEAARLLAAEMEAGTSLPGRLPPVDS